MEEGRNQRESQRSEASFSLTYSIEKPFALRISLGLVDEVGALMRDLSQLGAAIITKYDIPLGADLRIKFNLMNLRLSGDRRSRPMEIIANVVSNLTLPDKSHRLGVRFVKISEADKTAIDDFVKSR